MNIFANIVHEVWSHWMEYLFSVCVQNNDGSITIPAEKVRRWDRQIYTSYYDLSKEEQKSDNNMANRYKNAIMEALEDL